MILTFKNHVTFFRWACHYNLLFRLANILWECTCSIVPDMNCQTKSNTTCIDNISSKHSQKKGFHSSWLYIKATLCINSFIFLAKVSSLKGFIRISTTWSYVLQNLINTFFLSTLSFKKVMFHVYVFGPQMLNRILCHVHRTSYVAFEGNSICEITKVF